VAVQQGTVELGFKQSDDLQEVVVAEWFKDDDFVQAVDGFGVEGFAHGCQDTVFALGGGFYRPRVATPVALASDYARSLCLALAWKPRSALT
jgi:hypothetical protein